MPVLCENIPDELKARDQWVCWALEVRDGKPTKVPKRADTGGNAKSTGPATWTSFDNAVAACERFGFTGVGFAFADDRAVTGLDLDHVLDGDGNIAEEYRWIVDAANTYTEISPSGDGLHLFFLGGKPEGKTKCKHNQPDGRVVEMYDHARFFTMTGRLYVDVNGEVHTEMREGGDALEHAYDMWLDPKKGAKAKKKPARDDAGKPIPFTDDELIEKMLSSACGDKIRALLDGDVSGHDNDDSGADIALCNYLAFWTAGDPIQMDRIFRSSGLMREKWDEVHGSKTYGQMTIDKAVSDATEFYVPSIQRTGGKAVKAKARSIDSWVVDKKGKLWKVPEQGNPRSITSTPPYIVADLRDVDTGTMRALVGITIGNEEHECALDRDTLLSNTKIVTALAPLGANVSTSNARDVVSYVTLCDGFFTDRDTYESVTRMGWAKGALGPFMPYDAGCSDVRFDPAPDVKGKAWPFEKPKGTLDAWIAGIQPIRTTSVAFRAMLAASFASPLVAILGVQVFAVYLWGMSGSGKTPSLKAAGSVWGDPTEGANSYYGTFNDTSKFIVRKAAFLGDLPILVDELQSKSAGGGQRGKRQAVEDFIYMMSLGHERGALNSNRTMMGYGSWRGLTIATGEIPILADNTQQGALNRTLEINAEPFSDKRAAQEMHHLVAEQHGTAGRAFIEYLKKNDVGYYKAEWQKMRGSVRTLACDNPQAENIALLAFADALAEFCVFSPGISWEDACAAAKEFARGLARLTKTSDERDTDRKAIAYTGEWLAVNVAHFYDKTEMAGAVEKYGVREVGNDGSIWYVLANVFERAMAEAGYDRDKTLRRMRAEGIIQTSGKSLMKQKRMNGGKPYCVVIDEHALYKFLEGPEPQGRLDLGAEPAQAGASQPTWAA